MSANSKIEWTDHTFNPWVGCTKVSAACDYCYAEAWANRFGRVVWGEERRRTSASNWQQPLKWDRQAKIDGRRYRVFCASLADVFDNQVPTRWRDDLWHRIDQTPNLDFLLLTKRPQNIPKMLPDPRTGVKPWGDGWPNVWLGTTAENQLAWDRNVEALGAVPAVVHFVSVEPMLGPIDCGNAFDTAIPDGSPYRPISWVICGGESGSRARPMHPDWARSLRDQCVAAGAAYFFKQWGAWLPGQNDSHPYWKHPGTPETPQQIAHWQDGSWGPQKTRNPEQNYVMWDPVGTPHPGGSRNAFEVRAWASRVGKKRAGRLLDGREWSEYPRRSATDGCL